MQGLGLWSPLSNLKQIEYGVYADLIIRFPKPYSMYLRGTIGFRGGCGLLICIGLIGLGFWVAILKQKLLVFRPLL